MKHRVLPVLSAAVLGGLALPALAADSGLQPGTYKLDPSHSYAHFAVDHMGLSTMQGRIDVEKGTLKIGQDPSDSQVEVTLDPASVDTGDKARDAHLRDMDDFFAVTQYPQMRFKSTAVHLDDDDSDEATVDGQLTLHGVTRPVTLEVEDMQCRINPLDKSKYTCGFTAETSIQRSDYGMDAYSQLVGNEIEISLEVEADKPVEKSS